MTDARLIEGSNIASSNAHYPEMRVGRLAWAGHDFFDSIRNDDNWCKVKNVAEKSGAWTIDTLKQIAVAVASTAAQKYLGI